MSEPRLSCETGRIKLPESRSICTNSETGGRGVEPSWFQIGFHCAVSCRDSWQLSFQKTCRSTAVEPKVRSESEQDHQLRPAIQHSKSHLCAAKPRRTLRPQ